MTGLKRKDLSLGAVMVLLAGLALSGGEVTETPGGRLRKVADPVELLLAPPLTEAERQKIALLAAQLEDDDFDVRTKAGESILAYGPRALAFVKNLEKADGAETREFAKHFADRTLLRYSGYLPTAPELQAALAAPRRVFIGKQETLHSALERLLKDSELHAAFAWKDWPERVIGGPDTIELNLTTGEALEKLLAYVRVTYVARGNALAILRPEDAAGLAIQRHTFALPAAAQEQRKKLAAMLAAWLPSGTEVKELDDGIRVQGTEGDLRLAARALYCAMPEAFGPAPAADHLIFPKAASAAHVKEFFEALAAPVAELNVRGMDTYYGIAKLRSAGHAVATDPQSAALAPLQSALSLELSNVPLGCALRWLQTRANAEKKEPFARVQFVPNAASAQVSEPPAKVPLIQARLERSTERRAVSESVGCFDIAFLDKDAQTSDEALLAEVQLRLGDEVALFPCDETDFALCVFKRRLIVRGHELLLGHLHALLEAWRVAGEAPRAAWRAALEERLDKEIDWDGAVNVAALLPRLRDATGINILLERGPSPDAALNIEAESAQLLPPGRHRARALIQRLSEAANAAWQIKWGAVVLIPIEKK